MPGTDWNAFVAGGQIFLRIHWQIEIHNKFFGSVLAEEAEHMVAFVMDSDLFVSETSNSTCLPPCNSFSVTSS